MVNVKSCSSNKFLTIILTLRLLLLCTLLLVIHTPFMKQVATISANGDSEIGELIARAMEQVGYE